MKNLPEHEAFKALENRLNNYTEQPDDDRWQKIAAALPPRNPLWAPWLNRVAGILAVAILGWALWHRPAQVGGDTLTIVQPKSASTEDVATQSKIHEENAGSQDASLSPAGQQERKAEATSTNKKSTRSNPGAGSTLSTASAGLDSNVTTSRILNQHSGSTPMVSPDFNSDVAARSTARRASDSSPASSNATSNENRHPNLQPHQSTPPIEVTGSIAFVNVSPQGSSPKQESPLNNVSSYNPNAISPADEPLSTTALSIPALSIKDPRIKPIVSDSSQQEEILTTLSKGEATGAAGQKTPYNRPQKKRAGISFYALFSPTLSFQTATPSARDGVVIQKFKKPSMLSGDRLGLALEAGVQGRLSKKFEYFGGLSVYHQSQTLQYTYQNTGNVVIENGVDGLSYAVKPATAERSVSYNMLNVGAQAGVLYTLKEHRLSHKIGVALQYQRGLTHASVDEPYDNASSSYFNYQVLYRAEIALDNRLTFIVQPSITRTLLVNETLHLPFTLKQYRPGVSIGLSYKFRQ
ncbi:MAG TPA: hypothetical protein VIU12_23595 [Chryseolinea sp.]